jgi:protein-disulfide isomerase
VIVVVAIVVSSGGGGKSTSAPTSSSGQSAAASAAALFNGVPERNGVAGSSAAKVTVTEYLDLQCPICREASTQVIPGLVNNYVKTGKVKLQARTLHFIGNDSTTAALYAAGARQQGKFWKFAEAFYASQQEENSGYVTPSFLAAVAKASGVDNAAATAFARTTAAENALNTADSTGSALGIDSTPTFVVRKGNGAPKVVDATQVQAAVDAALKS